MCLQTRRLNTGNIAFLTNRNQNGAIVTAVYNVYKKVNSSSLFLMCVYYDVECR